MAAESRKAPGERELRDSKLDAGRERLRAQVARGIKARPSGQTRHVLVGLAGRGIQSSRTPAMHEREGARIGLGYTYLLLDFDELELADDHLGMIIGEAEQLGFAGLNITHPFKQAALAHVDELSLEAADIGAVNTIVLRRGRRVGHNTDSWGFAESFREGLPGVIPGIRGAVRSRRRRAGGRSCASGPRRPRAHDLRCRDRQGSRVGRPAARPVRGAGHAHERCRDRAVVGRRAPECNSGRDGEISRSAVPCGDTFVPSIGSRRSSTFLRTRNS